MDAVSAAFNADMAESQRARKKVVSAIRAAASCCLAAKLLLLLTSYAMLHANLSVLHSPALRARRAIAILSDCEIGPSDHASSKDHDI